MENPLAEVVPVSLIQIKRFGRFVMNWMHCFDSSLKRTLLNFSSKLDPRRYGQPFRSITVSAAYSLFIQDSDPIFVVMFDNSGHKTFDDSIVGVAKNHCKDSFDEHFLCVIRTSSCKCVP